MLNALKHLAAKIYGGVQAQRAACYAKGKCKANSLPCKVVCVGNLTVGGTGKTPMIMYLAALLRDSGVGVAILSRGYKGALEQKGGQVSSAQQVLLTAKDAGDEPYLLASRLKGVPVYVGRNRYAGGLKALANFSPAVILLDDGYQHLKLKRDINLLLMDAAQPLDNGHVLPLGMLREKPQALNRAQAVIFTRGHKGQNSYAAIEPYIKGGPLPHFTCGHKSYCYVVPAQTDLEEAFNTAADFKMPEAVFNARKPKAFVFAGIAKNHSFLSGLKTMGFEVVGHRFFNDHYAYTGAGLAALEAEAAAKGAEILVTTEKDHAKLKGRLNMDLAVFGVQIDFFGQEQAFADFVFKALKLS